MGWLVATTPCRATTSDRVWLSQLLARSPRTAVMRAPGSGIEAVGLPNGVGLGPAAPAAADGAPDALATPGITVFPSATAPTAAPLTLRNARRDVSPDELSDIDDSFPSDLS